MALYLKYRPTTLEDFVGNKATVDALEPILARKQDIPHAMLFTGPSGMGKTTLARIVKDALGCGDMDFVEIDAGDFRGIDTVRDIRRQMYMNAVDGPCRVWLLDEVHQMTKDGQSALLKALEDTPKHVYFILATTNPEKLLKTILTRCMTFTVQPLPDNRMMKLLKDVIRREKKEVADDVLDLIVRDALGSARMALVLLDKIIDADPKMQARMVETTAAQENQTVDLYNALTGKKGWTKIRTILATMSEQDPEAIRRSLRGLAAYNMLQREDLMAAIIMDVFKHPTYDNGWTDIVAGCYEVVLGK